MLLRKMLLITCFHLAGFLLQAQVRTDNYDARWKTVDSLLMKKGLVQSALTEVNNLYARAKQEKNDVQVIKALIYRMRLEAVTSEDIMKVQVRDLEEEIGTAKAPARSILENLLATVYWGYFQQHRWQLYNRTRTVNFIKTDIATWDAADFHKRIGQLYLSSLQEEKILQQTKLDGYDPILIKGTLRALRPTLFDLLAHAALDYFKNNETDMNRPEYAFELDDPAIFATAPVFVSHTFTSSDSLSLRFRALQLFQRLIALHLSDTKPDALLDVDIERIRFGYTYSVMDDKDTLYSRALAHLTDRYPDEPSAAQAWYLQAVRYRDQAIKYDPTGDTSGRYDYLPAKAICEKVLAEKDSSEGKANCQQLLQQIRQVSMNLQTERVNIPGQPLRSLLNWRNFSQLYLRVIRLDSSHRQLAFLNTTGDNYWKKMVALPVLTTMTQPLPETGDHQFHRTEIKIDALPVGEYALLASTDKDFSPEKSLLSVQYFFVSAISYINYDRDYFILNRESGQPWTDATVKCWNKTYNYHTSQYDLSLDCSYQTDAHGHLSLDPAAGQRNNQKVLEISLPGDHLLSDDLYVPYYPKNNRENTPPPYTYLFSDRSIYRPGQTVYFKGIVVQRKQGPGQTNPLAGFTSEIGLYNANEEKVDSLSPTTNDFGSYQGKFTLPESQLNGLFSLRSNNMVEGQLEFSVEEYRRPTFNVQYEKLKGSYRVGDTIRVSGNASAYTGNPIDGATVKYRVVRKARFPDFWFYRPRGRFAASTQEIAHGELKTGPTGKFTVPFTALPDRSINRQEDPIFEYQVSADITDINGETRSGETTVSAGYRALELFIERPSGDPLPADSLRELVIRTANLSGEPEPAALDIRIFSLQSPQRLIRARYWEQPDQFVLSRQEYLDAFPHDEYRDETNKETWARGNQLFSTTSTTDSEGLAHIPIPANGFVPGWYLAEVRTKDKYGQEVQVRQYIELYDGKTGQPATPQYSWRSGQAPPVEPGEKAIVPAGSSAASLFVIRKMARKADGSTTYATNPGTSSDSPGKFDFLSLSRERKITAFPVTENDRGGFWISDAFVKDNRFYTHSTFINVPWTNKELKISYLTYRDKTLPGSAETWQVKISGNKGQQVAAEALAAMYDASLDQFRMQSWSVPDLYETFSPQGNWQQQGDFGSRRSEEKYDYHPLRYFFNRSYDQLLSPEYYGNGGIMHRRELSPQMAMAAAPGTTNGHYDDVVVTALGVAKPNMKNEAKETLADSISIVPQEGRQSTSAAEPQVSIRKNFVETAFFFPDLRTDSAGDISFSFTMPEALTRWKWMTLAHTKDLSFGYSEKTIVTQKQLMVQPNLPRFLREGDRLELSAKIVNLTDSELTGQVELALTDPTTGETADGWFINRQPNQYFTVGARQSTVIGFPIEVPYQYNRPLTYRFIARARDYSDGEQATLPVVSNRMLVTESLPLNMPGDGKRSFHFEKLLQSGASETLNHHALTVEFSSNPAWYAVQALPYLMEYPYECAEQTFNRFYANALAAHIVAASPRIKEIFSKWQTSDTAALLSNLQKNTGLKSVLLEETPWVLQGKSESQQKKNIALLFDMVRMSRELESSLTRLSGMQSPNGGFVWFKGGPDDRYITQYILTGIGHLQKLNAVPSASLDKIKAIVTAALPYLDTKTKEDYEQELRLNKIGSAKSGKTQPDIPWAGNLPVQYLYMRSFFSDYGIPGDVFPAVNYYRKQVQQHWVTMSKYMQGMTALALFRTGDLRNAKDILTSLQQTAIRDEEKGMSWKGMEGGYYWYRAPIETQSLLIEAFREIGGNAMTDKDMKTWLLRQKQTHNWSTTKATADACYALLLGDADWLTAERTVTIKLGDKTIIAGNADDSSTVTPEARTSFVPTEAGTGYFKKVFDGPFINPSMGNITVTLSSADDTRVTTSPAANTPNATASLVDTRIDASSPGNTGAQHPQSAAQHPQPPAGGSPAWGAVYWQYFDNLDRITPPGGSKAALHLVKKLFIERNTDRGPVLEPISENGTVKVGDKLKVRIELQVDRDMEYVHMKDMRASCLEPVNVISQYKWQGGLGYYESTKDASTDFFFSRVGRGTYVFEYPLFVGQAGNFSNGVTTIECLYAPEFSWHSEGIRINAETPNP